MLLDAATAGLTVYSGSMFGRLRLAVPDAVLFGDIGHAAFGRMVSCVLDGSCTAMFIQSRLQSCDTDHLRVGLCYIRRTHSGNADTDTVVVHGPAYCCLLSEAW